MPGKRPDGSYQKVKPAEGEPIVNGQMGMYDLLRNDWTREEPWKPTTPKAAPAEAPAAEKQTAAEGPKAKTPEVPVQDPPKAKGPDFVEAAPATPAPIHLEPTEHPKGGDPTLTSWNRCWTKSICRTSPKSPPWW